MAKKLQEWVPTVANTKKVGNKSDSVKMFIEDDDWHVYQVFKNNYSKEDNVKLTIVQ